MNPIPLLDFQRRVLDYYVAARRKRMTVTRMKQLLGELLSVHDPQSTTADLTTDSVVRWSKKYGSGRSDSTLYGYMSYLCAAWNYAKEERWLNRSPRWKRVRPRVRRRVGPHLSLAQRRLLLEHLRRRAECGTWSDRRLYAAVAVALYTGLRRNELLYLRLEDVDLVNLMICVVPLSERDLKTEESAQPVPIPPELEPILAAWLGERGADREWCPYVFPGVKRRRPWSGGRCGRRPIDSLRRVGVECGVPVNDWRTLRRSVATAMETAWGRTEGEIKRVLRHTNPLTSLKFYRAADIANLQRIGSHMSYRA